MKPYRLWTAPLPGNLPERKHLFCGRDLKATRGEADDTDLYSSGLQRRCAQP